MKLAASIMLFAILMAIRDEVESSYLRMLVAAAAGASLALAVSSSKAGRVRATRHDRRGSARSPLWIATILYVLSWFLPVVKGGWTLDEGLPGWEAMTTALHPLWDARAFTDEPFWSPLWVASGLTNLFMVGALVRLHIGRTADSNPWHWVAWAAAAINSSWIWCYWEDRGLRIGYFLWLLSFVCLVVSFMALRHREQVEVPQVSTP